MKLSLRSAPGASNGASGGFLQRHQSGVWLLVVTLLALLVGLGYRSYDPRGLDLEGMDAAQIGRNVSEGRGLTTDFIRPFSLPATRITAASSNLAGSTPSLPEVTNAPLYPFLTGLAFGVRPAQDATVAALSLLCFALTAGLLFLLAQRLSGDLGTSLLACAAFLLSLPVLQLSGTGNPAMLSACLLLALLLILTPRDPGVHLAPRAFSRRYIGAGVVAGLCYLNQYVALLYLVPLALMWGRGWKSFDRKAAGFFVLGFALCALPWWIRNARVTGNPFYTLQWLDLAMRTTLFPGQSLLRDFNRAATSTQPIVPGAGEFIGKIARGVAGYFYEAPFVPHLYLMPFVLLAPWIRPQARLLEQSRVRVAVLVALGVFILGSSALGRVTRLDLVPLVPLLCLVGASAFRDLTRRWQEAWIAERVESGRRLRPTTVFGVQSAMIGALLVAFALPLLPFARSAAGQARGDANVLAQNKKTLRDLSAALPSNRAAISDIPWAVAWYADRPAAWIPIDTAQVPKLEDALRKRSLPVGALYLSPAILGYNADERPDQWRQIFSGGQLPNYERKPRQTRDTLLARLPTLEEAQRLANSKPNDVQAQLALGQSLLNAGRAAAARKVFARVQQQQPRQADGFWGSALVAIATKDLPAATRQLERVLQISPRFLPARLALAEVLRQQGQSARAIESYEQVLAEDPNNLIATNNLAVLYSDTKSNPLRALEMARRAVIRDPSNGSIWDTLGWVCYQAARYPEAEAYLSRALSLTPGRGTIFYHLGKTQITLGKRKEGIDSLTQALRHPLSALEKKDATSIVAITS